MMRLVIVLLLCSASWGQTPGLSTVRVYSYQKNADRYPSDYGSGWLVEDDKVVTAYHVIHKHKKFMVRFRDDVKSEAKVLAFHDKYDIALLWVSPHPSIRRMRTTGTPVFGKAAVHGYGYDFQYRYRVGLLGSKMKVVDMNYKNLGLPTISDTEGEWRALMCIAIPGDSGGCVTINGEVIGVVLASNSKYCVFCPIEIVKREFNEHLK